MAIKIVDLFAGPGGLGEGFSAVADGRAFQIIVSAEMEKSAHSTLRLRSFYRRAKDYPIALADYYRYCNGITPEAYSAETKFIWDEAEKEAQLLELGKNEDNAVLADILAKKLDHDKPWVLIGGPPCQAYSIVGRSRNAGKDEYIPEKDDRHFLYREYLRIIHRHRPPVFVMENVIGILSAKIGGQHIFHDVLRDLANPDRAIADYEGPALSYHGSRKGYRIHSLVSETFYESGTDPAAIDPKKFVIKAEDFGIPQARHRVILLGIREDYSYKHTPRAPVPKTTVWDVISDLPPIRSSLSKIPDSNSAWENIVSNHFFELATDAQKNSNPLLAEKLQEYGQTLKKGLPTGALRFPKDNENQRSPKHSGWYLAPDLKCWLNHEARGHMDSDLRRYAFAASFAEAYGQSPVGHQGFSLAGLEPNHANWRTGKFADRFRVQCKNSPATTVTSHISKDGHYFIHPDPTQCRSLTVREAARLQTFPDNYFFLGNRTQQYHQVGNAVPPLLAFYIAEKVRDIFAAAQK